ncbi:retention module-containing protein, partial [Maribrevibacterium harenarium]
MSDNQVSFATLGNAVGFVVQLEGVVRVQAIDGSERTIKQGDPIFYGETVVAVGNGSATIEFVDGAQIIVANEAVVEITDEIFSFGSDQELVADATTDAEALQQAILAGVDPTLIQDAPAAGEQTNADTQGESDRVDVTISRSNLTALPDYGYDTANSRSVESGGNVYYGPTGYKVPEATTFPAPTASSPVENASVTVPAANLVTNAQEATSVTVTLENIGSTAQTVSITFSDNDPNTPDITVAATNLGGGQWQVTGVDLTSLSDGDIAVTALVTDDGGNQSELTGEITLDKSADAETPELALEVAATDLVVDSSEVNDVSVTLSGIDPDAATVTVTFSDGDPTTPDVVVEAQKNATGEWVVPETDISGLKDGDITVKAKVIDEAGNESTKETAIEKISESGISAVKDSDADVNTISESAANGTEVQITGLATDADATDEVTYSLTNDYNGAFTIDATTGVVTVADNTKLDYESDTAPTIEITATSTDGSSSKATFTINLTDDTSESGISAVKDSDADVNTISESAANGTEVQITGLATDADATDEVTYSLTNDYNGAFTIDATTGVVTVADNTKLDYESDTAPTIEITATSTDGSSSKATFTINLTDD